MELPDLVPWAAAAGIAGLVGWIWRSRTGSDDDRGSSDSNSSSDDSDGDSE